MPGNSRKTGAPDSDYAEPSFDKLFPPRDREDTEDDEAFVWTLTPRTAARLHTALCWLSDSLYDSLDELGSRPISPSNISAAGDFGELPPSTWRLDATWRANLARAADDLASDLATGSPPYPRCTGEEAALLLAIELCDAFSEDVDAALPATDHDYDWGSLTDEVMQDTDVAMVLRPGQADGLERDEQLGAQLGWAHLHPTEWFITFDNMTARDPARGYRRLG